MNKQTTIRYHTMEKQEFSSGRSPLEPSMIYGIRNTGGHGMNRIHAIVVFLLLSPCAVAAGVSGSLQKEFFGEVKTMTVSDGYAFNAPDTFDESKEVTLVILSEQPFSKDGLESARDREDVISERLRGMNSAYVKLSIGHEYNTLESANFFFPDSGNISTSGNTLGKLTRFDGERVAGSLSDSDIQFDLPIAAPPELPEAVTLPADGGEPGRAYIAMTEAIASGDVDTLIRYSRPEAAEAMSEQRNSPEFAEELKFLQEMSAGAVQVTGGDQFGEDLAVLKIEGETAGEKFTGEVTMKKGSNGWYVEKESRKY